MSVIALNVLGAAPSDTDVARYSPCIVGLSIEYRVERPLESSAVTERVFETVRGPGPQPHLCVLDRRTSRADGREDADAFARELLADRITDAGWLDHLTAFRAPILLAPLKLGSKWHFNGVDYEISAIDERVVVPAGVFEGCVRVAERSKDGKHRAVTVFAPDVGVILSESNGRTSRAVRVTRPDDRTKAPGVKTRRPRTEKAETTR